MTLPWTIIMGPPGTGKTTALLNRIEQDIASGISPREIAFLSFTKKAASEALERAANKFSIPKTHFHYFKTMHGLAFNLLGLSTRNVMTEARYIEFHNLINLAYRVGTSRQSALGNDYRWREEQCRMRQADYSTMEEGGVVNLTDYAKAYKIYKKNESLYDYTDMIGGALALGVLPRFKRLYIDEAQDLSTLQWRFAKKLARYSDKTTVAGDDDQAIYTWAGADVQTFIDLTGEVEVLSQSYRLPKAVHAKAVDLISVMPNRRPKLYHPTHNEGHYSVSNDIPVKHGEDWLILVRNECYLADVKELLNKLGILFECFDKRDPYNSGVLKAIRAWKKATLGHGLNAVEIAQIHKHLAWKVQEDVQNRVQVLTPTEEVSGALLTSRFGVPVTEKTFWECLPGAKKYLNIYQLLYSQNALDQVPTVRLSTIHGAKGAEAENVYLLGNMTNKTEENWRKNLDDEVRVLYVGMTRAQQRLVLSPEAHRTWLRCIDYYKSIGSIGVHTHVSFQNGAVPAPA